MYRILTFIVFFLMAVSCGKSTAKEPRPPTEAEIQEYVEKAEAKKAIEAEKEAKKNRKINALKVEMDALENDIFNKTKKIERSRRRFFSHINQDTVVQWTLDIERGRIRVDKIREELGEMGVRWTSGGVGSMQ